jgi:serine/threonine-protein kinase
MDNKRIYDTIINSEPITKGWSEDKKYCVTTTDGMKYLLRISPISRYKPRKILFSMMEHVAALGVPMSMPIEFGTCSVHLPAANAPTAADFFPLPDDGVYMLLSWIDGEDLENIMPELSETEQYTLGLQAGKILRKMHKIFIKDIPSERPEWGGFFDHTLDERIQKYHECGLRFEKDEDVLGYLEKNRDLTENRPRCFQHGDYSIRNMMLENGEIKIIDFERLYFGDPWEDFNFVMLDAPKNPHFTTGQFRGYFNGKPPIEFFKTYAFHIFSCTLPAFYELLLSDTAK